MYRVVYSSKAKKQLQKLDRNIAKMLYAWIGKNLNGTDNPYAKGKALVGDRKDSWRYRVGAYRIIVEIRNNELVILVLAVGNRKDIYGSRELTL